MSLDLIRPVAAPDESATAAVALVGPGTVFTWDGKGQAGQAVDSGTYTLVVRTRDSFGGGSVLTTALTVIRTTSVVRVSIYNSAGELVRQEDKPGVQVQALRLDKEEIPAGAEPGEGVEVRWGPGLEEAWVWDGTDAQGRAVSSGSYTVQVTRVEAGKAPQTFLSSVTVVSDGGQPYSGAAVLTNPVKGRQGSVQVRMDGLLPGSRA